MSSLDPDRNLLWGILACELGFVDFAQMVASLKDWAAEKSQPIGELLVGRQELSPRVQCLLSALAEDLIREHRGDTEAALASFHSFHFVDLAKLEDIADEALQSSLSHLRVAGESSCEPPAKDQHRASGDAKGDLTPTEGLHSALDPPHGGSPGSPRDAAGNSPQDSSPDAAQNPSQDSSQNPSQDPSQDPSQSSVNHSLDWSLDAVLNRFESALNTDQRPEIDDYLADWKEPQRSELLRELLYLEIFYRRRCGDQPSLREYHARYGDQGRLVAGVFETLNEKRGDLGTHPKTEDSTALPIGSTLGDYELLSELGRGGMGIVYRAWQRNAKRIVALKVIRRDQLNSLPIDRRKRAVRRFQTEAQAAAGLEHDHVVTVYEVGEADGRQYYSMRLVDGQDLAEIVRQGPLDSLRAARYMESTARAVHEAHVHNILHRDIKPANVLIDKKTDRALVTDFGLARLMSNDSTETRAEDILGSPCYMSPEQAVDAGAVLEATDIYGIGATLYHLLAGRPPFLAANVVNTLEQVRNNEPAPLRQLNPDIPRDLETICLKCLAKDPLHRYASAADLADDLQRFVNDEPIRARPPSALELFIRWYPKHASLMLGAYYIVTPMTWVFYMLGSWFQPPPPDAALRLASSVFLVWACAWVALGYGIIKYGSWLEFVNIAWMAIFAMLAFLFQDAESIVLVIMITFFGCLLQAGAIASRRWSRPRGAAASGV